jgi:hypothetical protein
MKLIEKQGISQITYNRKASSTIIMSLIASLFKLNHPKIIEKVDVIQVFISKQKEMILLYHIAKKLDNISLIKLMNMIKNQEIWEMLENKETNTS